MKTQLTLLLALLAPLPALGIGYVYTGGGGRQLLELTSVTVDVQIGDKRVQGIISLTTFLSVAWWWMR